MSKILVFSDLHLHQHRKSSERLEHCLQVLEWVFKTAVEREIQNVLFLGDLFHDRQKIDTYGYTRTYQVFEKYFYSDPKFRLYLLVGNHDMFYFKRWDITSVTPMRAFSHVEVIDSPSTHVIDGHAVDFLPYTHDPIKDLNKIANPGKNLLCGHVAIDGAKLNFHHNTRAEIQIEHDGDMTIVGSDIFADWEQVFLGHYHGAQNIGINAEYVGSPLQLSFGEAFEKKHIIVYDLDNGDKEYIENTFSPKHFIIPMEERNDYPLEGNFFKLMTTDIAETEVVELRNEMVGEKKVGSFEIKPVEVEESEHLVEDAKAIIYKEDEMMQKYVEEQQKMETLGDLDPAKLMEIGKRFSVDE